VILVVVRTAEVEIMTCFFCIRSLYDIRFNMTRYTMQFVFLRLSIIYNCTQTHRRLPHIILRY